MWAFSVRVWANHALSSRVWVMSMRFHELRRFRGETGPKFSVAQLVIELAGILRGASHQNLSRSPRRKPYQEPIPKTRSNKTKPDQITSNQKLPHNSLWRPFKSLRRWLMKLFALTRPTIKTTKKQLIIHPENVYHFSIKTNRSTHTPRR